MSADPRFRISSEGALLDAAGFEAETAAMAVLGNLKAEGPASARDLLRRIGRAATIAGESVLPFKHATLYAVLHELSFDGAIHPAGREGPQAVYAISPRGRAHLSLAQERWRASHLVIRAAAAASESQPA